MTLKSASSPAGRCSNATYTSSREISRVDHPAGAFVPHDEIALSRHISAVFPEMDMRPADAAAGSPDRRGGVKGFDFPGIRDTICPHAYANLLPYHD
jgi:hypothetical protein